MTQREIRELERALHEDLHNQPPAVLERVRAKVKEFLYHEAGLLAGKAVKDEDDIIELLRLHARVNLLREMVENPKHFNMKDQKDLFRSLKDDAPALRENINPLSMIAGLDVDDKTKAELIAGTMAVIEKRLLEEGNVKAPR